MILFCMILSASTPFLDKAGAATKTMSTRCSEQRLTLVGFGRGVESRLHQTRLAVAAGFAPAVDVQFQFGAADSQHVLVVDGP